MFATICSLLHLSLEMLIDLIRLNSHSHIVLFLLFLQTQLRLLPNTMFCVYRLGMDEHEMITKEEQNESTIRNVGKKMCILLTCAPSR